MKKRKAAYAFVRCLSFFDNQVKLTCRLCFPLSAALHIPELFLL